MKPKRPNKLQVLAKEESRDDTLKGHKYLTVNNTDARFSGERAQRRRREEFWKLIISVQQHKDICAGVLNLGYLSKIGDWLRPFPKSAAEMTHFGKLTQKLASPCFQLQKSQWDVILIGV